MRFIIFTLLILFSAKSWASNSCTQALRRLPWIDAEVSNVPVKTLWETRGTLALFKGTRVIARICSWCPRFETQEQAEAWMKNHTLGQKTEMMTRRLTLFSQKKVSEHFFGITLIQGKIFYISKPPIGPSLNQVVSSTAPWIMNSQKSGGIVQAPLKIIPEHAVQYNRIRETIRTDSIGHSILGPLRFDLEKIHLDPLLSNFLGTLEWSLSADGKMNLSFIHLDHVYHEDGSLKDGLINDPEDTSFAAAFDMLISTLLILKNEDLPGAMNQMSNKKNSSLLTLPDFLQALSWGGVKSPLFYRLGATARAWKIDRKQNDVFDIWINQNPLELQTLHFATPALHEEHFRKHGHEFQSQTPEEYLKLAIQFVQGSSVLCPRQIKARTPRAQD